MAFKRTKCNCKECPLEGRKKVLSKVGHEKFSIALVGEAPTAVDEEKGELFADQTGAYLKRGIAESGLIWHMMYRMSVLQCRPTNGDITKAEGQEALECCMPGFLEEVDFLAKSGIKVIIPLGNTATTAMGVNVTCLKGRGSLFPDTTRKFVTMPTYHPAYICKNGLWKEEPTWIGDFKKARKTSLKKYEPPREKFNLLPTFKDVEAFVKEHTKKQSLLGVDIETTSLNEQYAKILMIGFAVDEETALVVPFTKKAKDTGKVTPYWNAEEEPKVKALLNKLFQSAKLMFQNASFDVLILRQQGYHIEDVEEDTMLLHHRISPELPHNLGYITSVYGSTPYWKDAVLGSEAKMINMDDEEVRSYNARDSVVLHQILPGELKHIGETGGLGNYRDVAVKLVVPLVRMTQNGLPVNHGKLAKKKKEFTNAAADAKTKCFEVAALPAQFNLDSPDQVRFLFWGIKPKSLEKAYVSLQAYEHTEEGKKPLNKNTIKYRELIEKIELYKEIKPFIRVLKTAPKTASGTAAVDNDALTSITRQIHNRTAAIEGLVRGTVKHVDEMKELNRLLAFITEFKKFSEADKLASTFTGFPIGLDGRVHPKFKIHGTTTGRLSSSEPKQHWALIA